MLTVSPFGASGRAPAVGAADEHLRTDSPEAKHSYLGNLALFGLQESHLNSCYYNQDLHSRPLHAASRRRASRADDRDALLHGAASLGMAAPVANSWRNGSAIHFQD